MTGREGRIIFYYDPSDPRIIVPKRIGLGWTLNFAHPMSWVLFAGLIALIGVVAYLRRKR